MDGVKKLTFVLGGAASGKSAYAESIVRATGKPKVYIATAQAFDSEMAEKISAHQQSRGADWQTIEAPLDLVGALSRVPPDAAVLVDCTTLWLSNLLLAERDAAEATEALIDALGQTPATVVVVSNEVGQGIVPATSLGRAFRSAQGALNQRLAAKADCVVQVIAGLPQALKGALPG